MQYATIEDTLYFWFGSNDTAGSGADGASAVFDVREGGASASAAPVLSGSATLLTHANYPAGAYEIAVDATAGNGFAANKSYGVFCTLAVDSQNPTGLVGVFRLAPVPANAKQVLGTALTEGAGGRLAGGIVTFFNVATPTGTVNSLPAAAPNANGGLPILSSSGTTLGYTVTTVTNLTNAATNGDLTTTMKASVNTEADTALSDAGVTATVTGRIDVATSTRLATASYTAPDNATITAIAAKTAALPSDPADASDIAAAFALVPAAILAATVDGIAVSKALEIIVAACCNVAVVSGSTVAFKKRNGTTTTLTVTYGSAAGDRLTSVIS